MKNLIIFAVLLLLVSAVSAQKGVDTQTQTIKDETNKVTSRSTDATRTFDWGKGKTRVRERLSNPYKLNSRRDVLLGQIVDTLREQRIVVDDAASRPSEGIIVTQPYVFAKGAVVTQSGLGRYGVLEYSDAAWTKAQYTLTIEIRSVDGIQSNVAVTAKVEGRAGNGLGSEWRRVPSSGRAEDEFLAKLVEIVTGVSPEPEQDNP
jgi:hypothetical protein